jgi:hypothetical protein
MLTITFHEVSLLCTIALRLTIRFKDPNIPNHTGLDWGLDITQVSTVGFSLLTNLVATSIIAVKAWKNRKWLTSLGQGQVERSERILALLVESGFLYCLSGVR